MSTEGKIMREYALFHRRQAANQPVKQSTQAGKLASRQSNSQPTNQPSELLCDVNYPRKPQHKGNNNNSNNITAVVLQPKQDKREQ